MADPSVAEDSVPVFPDADGGVEGEISEMNEVAEVPPEDGEEFVELAEDASPLFARWRF